VPDPSVQPPEGLRKIAAEALATFWNESIANIGEPVETLYDSDDAQESADAVLAALFDACEVRDEWGVHNTWPDGASETFWRGPRLHAEAVVRAQLKLGSTVERQLVRRCVLSTPPESVGPYPENVEGGG
jgi:hypothetical protein